MRNAKIAVETITIPTYPEGVLEDMPMFVENRVHQRSTGRVYPSKVSVRVQRDQRLDRQYTAVHLENDYLDVIILPQIGGRIFAAQDKTTGYDFFYRQHVIKPALIGALGSWISGGVEFNWPYHHRASGFLPCDFTTEQCADGSVICWLSEHEPVDRMKGMVGIVLRPDCAYLETRVKLTNRTPEQHSFLWWENAAVPVNEQYQIFFPHDVTYVNFHYLDSRVSYPIAGDNVFNGIDMTEPRDISMHKNTRDATSYFACASRYDFFGGYDHGKNCGVVHIADHHLSPGKKMFTWGYNQLSRSWERALTDTDGQYAELMAGSYTDNQPNFSWLEPYETKEFSQYWYPISQIGTPDYADLHCALKLTAYSLHLQSTAALGQCRVVARAAGETFLDTQAELQPCKPLKLTWNRPEGQVDIRIYGADGSQLCHYQEQQEDQLKMPPVKDAMPLATEVASADQLYRAGVHVDQYRDPAVMPDAYWLEALKRDPNHAPSLLGMARYSYHMLNLEAAKKYAEKAIHVLTQFNERLENTEAYYLYALILEALGQDDSAYDFYYKAAWCGSYVARSAVRLACLDLKRGDNEAAMKHAAWALKHDTQNPLAPVVLMLAQPEHADAVARAALANDPLNLLVCWLSGQKDFLANLHSEASQSVLDMVFDLAGMGQYAQCQRLLESLIAARPDQAHAMVYYTLAYFQQLAGQDFAASLRAAEKAPLGNTYPFRREEAAILRFAMEQGSSRAIFLLGCLLYDKRHYAEGGRLFEQYTQAVPDDYLGYRCLAIACYSHLGRQQEALTLMLKAVEMKDSQQLLFETVSLMDKLSVQPAQKIAFLTSHPMEMDNLFTELAKAYNQSGQHQLALDTLLNHRFIPCEGGEHAIADQYIFAHYALGMAQMAKGDYAAALAQFEAAQVIPDSTGAGIWNRCKNVPCQFRQAECLELLGRKQEAQAIYHYIIDIKVEFFSNMHLRELPYYQALCSRHLGLDCHAQNLMTQYKREWTAQLDRCDNGYFATTPFFISFMDDAAKLRRAYYLYLCGLVERFAGHDAQADAMLKESYSLNMENLYATLA